MNGGPIGLLLGYTVVGTICYSVMVSPSRLSFVNAVFSDPLSHLGFPRGNDSVLAVAWVQFTVEVHWLLVDIYYSGHIRLAERFVDPALSFAMGYNYLYNWLIVL